MKIDDEVRVALSKCSDCTVEQMWLDNTTKYFNQYSTFIVDLYKRLEDV